MPAIIIPRRHLIQPQGRIQLDLMSTLCGGLALCVNYGADRAQPVVGPTATTSTLGSYATTAAGLGSKFSSEGHEYASAPLSTEWTLMCFGQLGSGRSALISQCGLFASKPQTYLCGNTDASFGTTVGMLAFGCGSTAGDASFLTASGAIDADPHVYLGVHRPNNTDELWRDGVQLASRAKTAVVTAADGKMRIEGINTYTGWYSAANTHILDAAWSRALSADELAAVGENPWQMFRADPVRFYSLPSGPITLNSLSVSNITYSGARFTVGLTR